MTPALATIASPGLPASTPAPTACSPHTARGNLWTTQGPLFFPPIPLRIKCKVFVNTLPALHGHHSQPTPLGIQASNSSSNNTTHCFPRAFVLPTPPAQNSPSPATVTRLILPLSRPLLLGHLLRKARSGYPG